MRVLALDYGRARCGCAVSDPTGTLATPLEPVTDVTSRRGRARLRELITEVGAERVVVGLPLSLSGADSAQTAEAREFAAGLGRGAGDPGRALRRALHHPAGRAHRRAAPARTHARPRTCWRAGWPAGAPEEDRPWLTASAAPRSARPPARARGRAPRAHRRLRPAEARALSTASRRPTSHEPSPTGRSRSTPRRPTSTTATTTRTAFTTATTPGWRPRRPRRPPGPAASAAWTSAASARTSRGPVAPPRAAEPSARALAGRIGALIVFILVAAFVWFLVELFQPLGTSPHGSVTVVIPPHSSTKEIGALLQRDGVIAHGFFFELRATLGGERGDLRSGTYHLQRGHELRRRCSACSQGAPQAAPTIQLTISEGHTRAYVAALLRKQKIRGNYLAATRHSPLLDPRKYGAPRTGPVAGGLPVPRHLHAGQAGQGLGAGRRPAHGLQAAVRQGQPQLRPLQAPVPVRRADGRVADRGRGGLPEGPPAHRLGDLQPAGRPHDAPVRHHHRSTPPATSPSR